MSKEWNDLRKITQSFKIKEPAIFHRNNTQSFVERTRQSKDKSVVVKIWKRKWWLIGLTFVLIIVSIAIGLGIHFGAKPEPPPTTIPQIPSTSVIASNSPSSTTNRSETVVLILSTYLPSNVPMLIGLNRKSDMIFFFNSYIFC